MLRQHMALIMHLCMCGQPGCLSRVTCEAECVREPTLQVDYAAAGIFINITTDSDEGHSAPWWQLEGARMAPGLEPLTPVCPCPMIPHT